MNFELSDSSLLITSKKNQKIDRWKTLQKEPSFRKKEGAVLIEGRNVILDILSHFPSKVRHLLIREDAIPFLKKYNISCSYTVISALVFKDIAQVEESDGLILECSIQQDQELGSFLNACSSNTSFLILDRVQDPGNVGTLIRTAAAFGIKAVIAIRPTCDLWNPKVVRSGKGAHFQLELFESSWDEIICLQPFFPQLIATYPKDMGAIDIDVFLESRKLQLHWALVLGNESQGVSIPSEIKIEKVSIPITDKVESLNVAQAGAILLYLLSSQEAMHNRNNTNTKVNVKPIDI